MKELIREENTKVLLIQENKLSNTEMLSLNKQFWANSTRIVVSYRGASGGIGIFWNPQDTEVDLVGKTQH